MLKNWRTILLDPVFYVKDIRLGHDDWAYLKLLLLIRAIIFYEESSVVKQ